MKKALQWTRGERMVGWSALAAVCVLAFVTLWVMLTDTGPPELAAGSDLVLPLGKLKMNKLFLFRYRIDSSTLVPVAVQKGPDGTIHAAFAACRPCLKSGSYEWSGKVMCGHCRHIMKMPGPGAETPPTKSGCGLPKLEYTVEANSVTVRGATVKDEFAREFLTPR